MKKPNHFIDAEKILKVIYSNIESEIGELQFSLDKNPSKASSKWRDNVWDVDEYASFEASTTLIANYIYLISRLEIPKSLRDMEFEKKAIEWGNL